MLKTISLIYRSSEHYMEKFNTKGLYLLVDKHNINYLKYIIEAYDNAANLTTIKPERGLVFFSIATGCEDFIMEVIEDLSKSISVKLLGNLSPIPKYKPA